MKIFNKDIFKSSPDSTYLLTGGGILISIAIGLGYPLWKRWDTVKKLNLNHSLLWLSVVCFGFGGTLLLILGFLNEPRIVLPWSKCIHFYHAAIISVIGIAFVFLWFIFISCRFTKWLLIEIKSRLDDSTIGVVFLTIKDLFVDLSNYIREKFRNRLQDNRTHKGEKS